MTVLFNRFIQLLHPMKTTVSSSFCQPRSARALGAGFAFALSLAALVPLHAQTASSNASRTRPAEDIDAVFADLAAEWRRERDALVATLTEAWLAARPASELRRELLQLAALETRLANEPKSVLYTSGLGAEVREPQDVLAHVARARLRERGLVHEPGKLLRQRPFNGVFSREDASTR